VVNFAAEKAKRADPKARKSQFFTATMLDGKEVPPRNWLVPGLIPAGTVTLLTGDGGTGKSLLALQLATACALGKPWLGKTVAGGRALFVSAEDDEDELHRRLADVLDAEDASFADLDQLALRSLAGEDALLTELDILDPSAPGCPVHQIKVADQFKTLLDPRRSMGVDTGRSMAEWAKGQGDAQRQKEVLDHAREKAREGTARFTDWWRSDEGIAARSVARTIIDELKALAEAADRDAVASEDDPFGGSVHGDDDGLTDDQRAELEAAEAAFRAAQSEPA
jgi:hypothetical protein